MPVIIRITKDGIAILLNRLPILIISAMRSSNVPVILLSMGASTMPRKIEPPTHIEAATKCTQVNRLSVRDIFNNYNNFYQDILFMLR
jgi:hypothetical protein